MTERDKWTPRERGWVVGYGWAKQYEGDPSDLKPTADGDISGDMEAAIGSLFVEPDDLENPSLFWGGFSHGVGAYLALEEGITTRTNRPPRL